MFNMNEVNMYIIFFCLWMLFSEMYLDLFTYLFISYFIYLEYEMVNIMAMENADR